MLGFSRVSGGDPNLFGSSVKHNQKIRLVLKEGSVDRELNTDWYIGHRKLFEVEMSYTQFAELISSMNTGDGVPVTIRYTDEKGFIEGAEITSKCSQFLHEFQEANNQSAATAKELIAKIEKIFSEKRQIKAAEREEILDNLCRLSHAVENNNNFTLHQFNEAMEKIATEAKGEVEAFVQNKIISTGLVALKEQSNNPILLD